MLSNNPKELILRWPKNWKKKFLKVATDIIKQLRLISVAMLKVDEFFFENWRNVLENQYFKENTNDSNRHP